MFQKRVILKLRRITGIVCFPITADFVVRLLKSISPGDVGLWAVCFIFAAGKQLYYKYIKQ
jgi:hypothetical protein